MKAVRAFNAGGLIQLRFNRQQRSNIDDGIPAHMLPDFRNHINGTEIFSAIQKGNPLSSQHGDQVVDNAAICAGKIGYKAADNDG